MPMPASRPSPSRSIGCREPCWRWRPRTRRSRRAPSPGRLLPEVNYLRVLLDRCRIAIDDVFANLYHNGVSVDIVFQVERMRLRVARAEQLLDTWMAADDMRAMARLTAELVKANQESQSVPHLLRSNFSLLARKVVEYNADTGEHYIARDRQEYLWMLRMAAGGGWYGGHGVREVRITGAHCLLLEGLLAGINYPRASC